MKICYYLSSHGYGHAARASAICGHFSDQVRLVFRTLIPRAFFEEEIGRSFEYFPAEFDCGCVQNDSITVEVGATIERYRQIAVRNRALLSSEARWLDENGIEGVVSDMPPFALEAAATAGIPSAIATNFTWHHIYREYLTAFPAFKPNVDEIRRQYSMAGLMFEVEPAMEMDMFPNRMPAPVVGREGRERRPEIMRVLGIDPGKHLGLIYTGTFGMDRVPWQELERFQDWEFLGLLPLSATPANYHLVSKELFRYQDLTASVDAVISKVGYGTYAESLLNGVPLLYVPRDDFAEFPVLEEGLKRWGHGYRIEAEDFYTLRWDQPLAAAVTTQRPQPVRNEGARFCAREIEAFFRAGGKIRP